MVQKITKYSFSLVLKIITPGDKILMVLIIILGIVSLVALNRLRRSGDSAIIEVDGQIVQQLDLKASKEITVHGSIGKTIIKIDQGAAQVIYSDCPEQVCVKTGKINRAGEIIVCVPNKVVVKISGKQQNQFDVITQ
jgi:hypothetical protein